MNDRTMGGSALRPGHIELMFNRRGTTQDDLGLGEAMSDTDSSSNQPIKTHHTYWLKFTRNREEAFNAIYLRGTVNS